ncbi:MAG: DUF58 domain-containing protein [Phycisphaerales bacterium]|nr:DUF58 domain-containing protein [Phycisphaerales bacterium]
MKPLPASVVTFDPALLSGLWHRRLATPAITGVDPGTTIGQHRSRLGGAGHEFLGHRPYVGGDDLRRLDWQVLARTGRLFTREFAQFTRRRYWLALDVSAGMTFTGFPWSDHQPHSKLASAQGLALALTQLIQHQQDLLGLALLTDRCHKLHKPGSSVSHARELGATLSRIEPVASTNLASGLEELVHQHPAQSTLILLSDFLCDDIEQLWEVLRWCTRLHWQVIIGHVIHPDEIHLPAGHHYSVQLMDLETGQSQAVNLAESRNRYVSAFEEHRTTIQRQTRTLGGTYHRWYTSDPWHLVLERWLA